MPDDSKLEETRKDILFKQKDRIKASDKRDVLLTVAFILGFFGPAAVLMPSDSPTGMFTGEIELESPEIERSEIRSIERQEGKLSFVYDSEVANPNILEAELERTAYRITVNGETVKKDVKPWKETIPAENSRMITYLFEIDTKGLPAEKEISGDSNIILDGNMKFESGGESFTVPFSRVIS